MIGKTNPDGVGEQSPRRCSICNRELNLFNCASVQWIPPEIVDDNYGEIDFLCPQCFLMLRGVYNTFVEQMGADENGEET